MSTENLFDVTLNLYKDSKSKANTLDCIRSFLDNAEYQKTFVAHINKLLNVSATRLDGLQLLVECIGNISANVLSEQGSFWVKCCLSNYEHSKDKEIYLRTLRSIIENSQKHSEFSRKLGTEFLSSILDLSLNSTKDLCTKKASLECLTSCLKYYSSFCKHHKRRIEDYLLSFLESTLESLVVHSGETFIHCQKIPTVGNYTTSCINNLTLSLRKLCITCHQCLDDIFEQWLEIEGFEMKDVEPYKITDPPLHYNSFLKVQYRTQIIINILQWIITFFSEEVSFIVFPEEILSVLARGLSMHKCSKEISIEMKYLWTNLMQIQTRMLAVLSVITLSLKGRIAPFFPSVSEILRDVLKSKNCVCYKNCKLFQEYFYEVLLTLLLIGHGLEKPLQNALVSQIIAYNTPSNEGATLNIHANLVGKSYKSKRNVISSGVASLSHLKGLLILMKGDSLDGNILDKITCFLLNNIWRLQKGGMEAPFDNPQSQLLLYEILCLLFEHDEKIIFLNYGDEINKVFINGCISDNVNISEICHVGLRNMEKVFQALKNGKCSHSSEVLETAESIEPSGNAKNQSESAMARDSKAKEITILEDNVVVPAKIENQYPEEFESSASQLKDIDDEMMNDSTVLTSSEIIEASRSMKEDESLDIEENCATEDLQREPDFKKRKVEDNIEFLFSNEFNEDYK